MAAGSSWDACTMEPNSWLRWVECHPGLASWIQGIGTLAALIAAVIIPLIVHKLQAAAADAPRKRSITRLADALQNLDEHIKGFSRFATRYLGEENGEPYLNNERLSAANLALVLFYQAILDAADLLPKVSANIDLEQLEALQQLHGLSTSLEQARATATHELGWIRRTATVGVIRNSLQTGSNVAETLGEAVAPLVEVLTPFG